MASGGPTPVSYRTVPGRHRTQKWQQAKTYNYDGDEWAGYDAYDEYDEPYDGPAPSQQPDGRPHGYDQRERQNSFEGGDERRQFSAGATMYGADGRDMPVREGVGNLQPGHHSVQQHQSTGPAPPYANPSSSASGRQFPPRGSSLSAKKHDRELASHPRDGAAGNTEKDLPIPPLVRPSDIYKRMAAEQERERNSSLDSSSRPSLDNLSRGTGTSAPHARQGSSVEQGPGTFVESRGEDKTIPMLPSIKNVSGIGTSFLHGSSGDSVSQPVTRAPPGADPAAGILAERTARAAPKHDPAADILRERFGESHAVSGFEPRAPLPELPGGQTRAVASPGSTTSTLDGPTSGNTRAPPESDSAARIMAERLGHHTRAPPDSDPAAQILAERTSGQSVGLPSSGPDTETSTVLESGRSTRAEEGTDPAAQILSERLGGHTRAPPNSDPAGDILAERLGSSANTAELAHQPSFGYRSVVHQGFEQAAPTSSQNDPADPDSNGASTVSRFSSTATSDISPIISRASSSGVAPKNLHERGTLVPTISEEPNQAQSSSWEHGAAPNLSSNSTARASRSYQTAESNEPIQHGYRRSLDLPQSDNSPARSPSIEQADRGHLTRGYSAESDVTSLPDGETPAVPDQGVETMTFLQAAETPAGERPTPMTGSAHADRTPTGTDHSMREAELARQTSMPQENREYSPDMAAHSAAEQKAFLENHTDQRSSQTTPSASGAFNNGRPLSAKGRVREIVNKYGEIATASRSSSRSGISSLKGSTEDLPGISKSPRSGSFVEQDKSRPVAVREESFRPQLPGQWVSYAPTPMESPGEAPGTPRASNMNTEEEAPDFSPEPTSSQKSYGQNPGALAQVKHVGEALGASLLSSTGMGHRTRDFAAPAEEPAPEVEQPSARAPPGDTGDANAPMRPDFGRGETDTSVRSAASSALPTLVTEDTSHQQTLPARWAAGYRNERPLSSYFSGAVAPLRTGRDHSQKESAEAAGLSVPDLGPMTQMSTEASGTDLESDVLRKEIVRSLGPETLARQERAALSQDAINAPENMRKVETGKFASSPAESGRPPLGLLNQRFSWEDQPQRSASGLDSSSVAQRAAKTPTVNLPEGEAEILPEEPYERPRSRALHIMNAGSDEDVTCTQSPQRTEYAAQDVASRPSHEGMERALGDGHDGHDDMPVLPLPKTTTCGDQEVADARDPTPSRSVRSASAGDKTLSRPRTASREASAPPVPAKIPAFREILSIRSPQQRIETYNKTRQTFAEMNTGLSDWLRIMSEKHAEQAGVSPQPTRHPAAVARHRSGSGLGTTRVHKHSPSGLAKFKQSLTGTASTDVGGRGGPDAATDAGPPPPPPPPKDAMWEQRGKGMIKNAAGAIGGKAQAGAKGLWTKGIHKWGTRRDSGDYGRP